MSGSNYYDILGVQSDADEQAIKKAYRKLARRYHPGVSDTEDAEEKFKEVQTAYDVLKDPDKRGLRSIWLRSERGTISTARF